jgi:hypothetical protein
MFFGEALTDEGWAAHSSGLEVKLLIVVINV